MGIEVLTLTISQLIVIGNLNTHTKFNWQECYSLSLSLSLSALFFTLIFSLTNLLTQCHYCSLCCTLRFCLSKKVSVSSWLFPSFCRVPIRLGYNFVNSLFSEKNYLLSIIECTLRVFNHHFHYYNFQEKSNCSFLIFLLRCLRTS